MNKVKSVRFIFLGLVIAVIALCVAPANAAPPPSDPDIGYTVSTPIYRLVPGNAGLLQVTYRVKADCDAQALSHWVLGLDFECIPCSAIVGSFVSTTNPGSGTDFGKAWPVVCGYDPTTKLTGVKFDNLYGVYAPEKCKEAYYTLIIDLDQFGGELVGGRPGLSDVPFATKSGRFTGIDYGTVCAPACVPGPCK